MRLPPTIPAALAAAWLVTAPGACADDGWGHEFDFLIRQGGTTVSERSNENGQPQRVIDAPGGVRIVQTRAQDGVRSTIGDYGGLGAVGCAWMVYGWLADAVPRCGGDRFARHGEALRSAADRIAAFMVEHSGGLYTHAGLAGWAERMRSDAIDCSGDELALVRNLSGRTADAFRAELDAEIDRLLSVPRFPALDPCL